MISFTVQPVLDGQCGPAPHTCCWAEELHVCRTYLLSTTVNQLKASASIYQSQDVQHAPYLRGRYIDYGQSSKTRRV